MNNSLLGQGHLVCFGRLTAAANSAESTNSEPNKLQTPHGVNGISGNKMLVRVGQNMEDTRLHEELTRTASNKQPTQIGMADDSMYNSSHDR